MQDTIDRLRAELAEARAVATRLQATNHELHTRLRAVEDRASALQATSQTLQSRLDVIQAYAHGQDARHTALDIAPGGDDWNMLFDLVTA